MKIDFTKKEYRLLLDILSISDWVMSSHKDEPDERVTPYEELQQKIFSCAENFGFDNLISYDESLEGYSPTLEFEDESDDQDFIDEYDEDSFWDALAGRLAQRDLMDEIGSEAFIELDPVDRINMEDKKVDNYLNEFETNGIVNLRVNPERVQ